MAVRELGVNQLPYRYQALAADTLPTPSTLNIGDIARIEDGTDKIWDGDSWKNYISDSGSGASTTADGADVTQGAIADAAIVAGATGSLSAKLRSISRDIGAQGDAAVYDPASSGTLISLLKGLLSSKSYDVVTTITRPANTTPYSALDVVGGALDLGILGKSGKSIILLNTQLEYDVGAIPAGMSTWTLHLYSVTPPSAIADNGAWNLPSDDRASYLGAVPLGILADLGSTLYVETTDQNKKVLLSGTNLFAYLVTTTGFTPAGNSEVLKLTIHTEDR